MNQPAWTPEHRRTLEAAANEALPHFTQAVQDLRYRKGAIPALEGFHTKVTATRTTNAWGSDDTVTPKQPRIGDESYRIHLDAAYGIVLYHGETPCMVAGLDYQPDLDQIVTVQLQGVPRVRWDGTYAVSGDTVVDVNGEARRNYDWPRALTRFVHTVAEHLGVHTHLLASAKGCPATHSWDGDEPRLPREAAERIYDRVGSQEGFTLSGKGVYFRKEVLPIAQRRERVA